MPNDRVGELYRRFGPAIFSRCRRLLRDDAAAEDATQEVFMRVLRHIDAMPDDAAVLGWIYKISTNYCLNVLRDGSRQWDKPVESLPEEGGVHPEHVFLDRDLAMRVVMRAPERLRAPAVLHYIDGLEQVKVADLLGISRRTVINRLAEFTERARKFLVRAKAEVPHE